MIEAAGHAQNKIRKFILCFHEKIGGMCLGREERQHRDGYEN